MYQQRACSGLLSSTAGPAPALALAGSRRRGGRRGPCVAVPSRSRSRSRAVVAQAASDSSTLSGLDAIGVVKKVCKSGRVFQQVSGRELFESLVVLNKIKAQKPDSLMRTLADATYGPSSEEVQGGEEGSGNFWKLVFTVSKKNLIMATSEGPEEVKGNGGSYFPITAIQNWCMQTMRIQNGIFLLGLVSMVFSGDFEIAYDRILYFDFDRLDFKLGPLAFGFDLPANEERVGKKRPFFVFLYADDEVCIARGRGGGIAVWKRVDRQFREDENAYV